MILLDTHIWIWWINEPEKLKQATVHYLDKLPPTHIHISIFSCWELAKLIQKGKLRLSEPLSTWFEKAIDRSGITVIELERGIIADACNLPGTFHNDPADQLIVATSRVKNLPLLTADAKILKYEHVLLRNESDFNLPGFV